MGLGFQPTNLSPVRPGAQVSSFAAIGGGQSTVMRAARAADHVFTAAASSLAAHAPEPRDNGKVGLPEELPFAMTRHSKEQNREHQKRQREKIRALARQLGLPSPYNAATSRLYTMTEINAMKAQRQPRQQQQRLDPLGFGFGFGVSGSPSLSEIRRGGSSSRK